MKKYLLIISLALCKYYCFSQSLEIMPGHEHIFADIQWLKFMDDKMRWSVFSRTRATVDYSNQSDLFTGAYLNYTSKNGLGASFVGKIAGNGGGADAGLHIFKARDNWMLFGLASAGLKNELEYSWFSIFRFTPKISENIRLYSSLELFHLFARENHLVSVQRIRLGLDYQKFQFGLGANFTEVGRDWTSQQNVGGFLRRSF